MTPSIRYHFVGNAKANEPLDMLLDLDWEDGVVACTRHSWVWPAYCRLRMCGLEVSFSYELEKKAVNLVHCENACKLFKASDFRNYFIVGIRADYRPFPYGQLEVVQNQLHAGGRCIYMPHLPQPGLIPRKAGRTCVENIGFSGRPQNFVDADRLSRHLKRMGFKYVFKGEGEWHDMSEIDILLGIRSFSKKTYDSKPATKLVNAWLAGIPFIGGFDSAYEQVGEPGKNYLKASTLEELLDAIGKLKHDPQLYKQMVDEGRAAARPYTADKITEYWKQFLTEQVAPAYRAWEMHPQRARWRAALFGVLFFIREKIIAPLLKLMRPR